MENNNIHILIVEDESITALDMKFSLEREHYNVTSIEKTLSGVKKSIKKSYPNIAIVDINLDNKAEHNDDGITIGHYLNSLDIPIIYLTSYTDTFTIKKALETDPICYLIKPTNIKELISNIILGIYKINTRINSQLEKINRYYSFDVRLNKLLYNGMPIPLSKMELKFLKILLYSKEELVLIEDIEYHLWKNKPIKNSALRTIVYRIRKKLPRELIQTIPHLGFSFIK